jgi:acyl carrier protein
MGIFDRIKRAFEDDDAVDTRPDDEPPASEITARLCAFLAEHSDGQLATSDIDPDEHLYDAGYVDSQSSVALLAYIEESWGVEVSEVDLVGRLASVSALARLLRSENQR